MLQKFSTLQKDKKELLHAYGLGAPTIARLAILFRATPPYSDNEAFSEATLFLQKTPANLLGSCLWTAIPPLLRTEAGTYSSDSLRYYRG